MGAFGETLPQNVPVDPSSPAAKGPLRVSPVAPTHKDAVHLGPEGLPHAGAIIWPGQVRVKKDSAFSGAHP